MTTDTYAIKCPKCRNKATEVIHAETKVRKGWYCPKCGYFHPVQQDPMKE